MLILLISPNTLFKEIIQDTTSKCVLSKTIEVEPDLAAAKICETRPEVIIIDETIDATQLEHILAAARQLTSARTILLNPKQNDIVLLNSHRATLRKVDDLMEAIMDHRIDIKEEVIDCDISESGEAARTQAGMYGFLAALFNQRPDTDLVKRLRSVGVDAFFSLAEEHELSDDVNQGLREMARFVEETQEQPEADVEQTLAVDWTRLFRGVSPTYGPPPPYEGLYAEGGKDGIEILQTINRNYMENGVMIEEEFVNRPDYLGLELGFLSYLAEQEAAAWENGEHESARLYADKAETFLVAHPGSWAGKFATTALEHAQTGFYQGFLRLCRGVMA